MITLATVDQFSYFSLLNSERICRGSWNYNYHLPLYVAALPCKMQVVNYTALHSH